MTTFPTLAALKNAAGQDLGATDYVAVTQAMIDQFAGATGDHQWIHVDVEKARQFSPFGGPIAHGFLTLSLAPQFMAELFRVESVRMGVNYGTNRVRFTDAVPAGARVRMRATLAEVENFPNNGVRLTLNAVFEREASEKPVCVAELVSLLFE